MNHNALVIEKANLGISEANPFEALEAAFELIKDPLELKTFQNNIQAIKKTGVEDIITKLLSMTWGILQLLLRKHTMGIIAEMCQNHNGDEICCAKWYLVRLRQALPS